MAFTHYRSPYAFMGYQCPIEESKIGVISVPYDGTVSYRAGTRDGPHAIITASRQVEFFDMELNKETAFELGMHTFDEIEPDASSPEKTVGRIEEAVEEVLEKGLFPLTFGGEHTIAIGPVQALSKKHKNLSILHIDAHADLRDSYEGTRFNHACAMRRIREAVKKTISVGIRSVSKEELDYIEKEKIRDCFHFGPVFDAKKILDKLSDTVYITLDLDGIDPSEAPAVGTPEPGGLRYLEVLRLLRAIGEKKKIVGFDINELCPITGNNVTDFLAAKLAYKMLGYSFFLR